MDTTETETAGPIHLTADDHHVIGPEDFGAPGLSAHESVGPFAPIAALGILVTVHDSRFDAHAGIGHHPHRGMERLFYILEGTVEHDDTLNDIQGHMGTGDLGILTEGRGGMVHSEWNDGDEPARAYILVYPTEPTPPVAAFDAIRDAEARRDQPRDGVAIEHVVEDGDDRLHGDLRTFADASAASGAALTIALDRHECGLLFVVDGSVEVAGEDGSSGADRPLDRVAAGETVLLPPAGEPRALRVAAHEDSRVLHAVTGPGYGLRRAG